MAAQDYNPKDFIPHSSQDPAAAWAELKALAQTIKDRYLKTLVEQVLADEYVQRRLPVCPAGRSIHHACVGGLIDHILSCTKLGAYLADYYQLDKDYVLAGTILHDVGKIYEFSEDDLVDYTDEGKLLGHIVKGLEIVDHYIAQQKDFPQSIRVHLKHILAAHHGELDCGSPKVPQTPEAYLVHLIDYLDSKLDTMKTAMKGPASGDWINYNKALDRAIYRKPLPHADSLAFSTTETIPVTTTTSSSSSSSSSSSLKQSLADKLKDIKIDK